jgi:hypothetical protein
MQSHLLAWTSCLYGRPAGREPVPQLAQHAGAASRSGNAQRGGLFPGWPSHLLKPLFV